MQAQQEQILKLLLAGNQSVGKSAFLDQFIKNQFNEKYIPTIGIEFNNKSLELSGQTLKLQIWDTSGQKLYMPLVSGNFRGSHGILILYDVTNKQSFNDVQQWFKQVKQYGNKDVSKMLVGNKNDLKDVRQVTFEEGQQVANANDALFIELSAKDGINVEEAIKLLAAEILNQQEQKKQEAQAQYKCEN